MFSCSDALNDTKDEAIAMTWDLGWVGIISNTKKITIAVCYISAKVVAARLEGK